MNDHENETADLTSHGDVIALMLAAVDDREGMDRIIKTLRFGEVPELLHAAIEVGGTLIRLGDQAAAEDRGVAPRQLLTAVLDSCRGDVAE